MAEDIKMYYPEQEVVEYANVKDWNELIKGLVKTMRDSGQEWQMNFIGSNHGINSWMIQKNLLQIFCWSRNQHCF